MTRHGSPSPPDTPVPHHASTRPVPEMQAHLSLQTHLLGLVRASAQLPKVGLLLCALVTQERLLLQRRGLRADMRHRIPARP